MTDDDMRFVRLEKALLVLIEREQRRGMDTWVPVRPTKHRADEASLDAFVEAMQDT